MHTGVVADSITLTSDDPLNPVHTLLFRASVRNYYRIVDDLDTTGYHESGVWSFSSGKAYGTTSRYIYPVPGASATFQTVLRDGGPYEVSAILPTTVNASTRARYALLVDGIVRDSLFRDQNTGSGAWVTLFHTTFNPGALASVVVTDAMSPVVAGKVLRADAIRFSWIPLTGSVDRTMVPMPDHTSLAQNYPNPFNSSTLVVYEVSGVRRQESVAGSQSSDAGGVKLGIYDILGREVAVLVDEKKAPGRYEARWDAAGLPSGVYFCRLTVGAFVGTTKMLLMR
jgi:hypothetical protein